MDKLRAFIDTMTVWNWIALIAFIIALVSGLNALLSLRARWRDWIATQTKDAFRQQLSFIRKELVRVETYSNNPRAFSLYLLDEGAGILLRFVMAGILCVAGLLLIPGLIPMLVPYPLRVPLAIGGPFPILVAVLFVLFKTFSIIKRVRQTITHIRFPHSFASYIVNTIETSPFPLEKQDRDLLNRATAMLQLQDCFNDESD